MSASPELTRLLDIMARLRDPETGCPWDREQSFRTIAPYTIEEAYEVAEAAEAGDPAAFKDELGDLLFQVVFHARMAEEQGLFEFNDVAQAISDKMIRRHPHVFGDLEIGDAAEQTRAWEARKADERKAAGASSVLDGVGAALPALTRAEKLQKRAARVGFDWPDLPPVLDKIEEELKEVRAELGVERDPARLEDEIGDLLFSVVNLARRTEIDPEQALRKACRKFERRFRQVETRLTENGNPLSEASLDDMEAEWRRAKEAEK